MSPKNVHLWRTLVFAIWLPLLAACPAIVVVQDTSGDVESDASETTVGDECTVDDDCKDMGTNCDANTCTAGLCVLGATNNGCVIDDVCVAPGIEKDGDRCDVCDPATDATNWSDPVCDQGNTCETYSCNSTKGCEADPVANGTPCDDGLSCTTDEVCSDGVCAGTCGCEVDADCPQEEAPDCQKYICKGDNTCELTSDAAADGDSCGDVCSSGGTCSAGACAGATPKDCSGTSGASACSPASCNAETGACEVTPSEDGSTCDDGDLCTEDDVCGSGQCAGTAKNCGLFDTACAAGQCDAATGGCNMIIDEGASCVPGNSCVINAVCDAIGSCNGAWDTVNCSCGTDVDCDDGNGCTTDTCDVGSGSCYFAPNSGTCFIDDNCYFDGETSPGNECLLCSTDLSSTTWSQPNCNDGEPCTVDFCDAIAGCQTATAPVETACDDGDLCTSDETCNDAGLCAGNCECKVDADCLGQATAGQCEIVRCLGFQCVTIPDLNVDGDACDDGSLCTTGETCSAGVCGEAVVTVCEPSSVCVTAGCNAATGECAETPVDAGQACDDDDPCTDVDVCDGTGTCAGGAKDCSAFEDPCNDALCTAGTCIQQPKDGATCDDGEACTTTDACTPSGVCAGDWDEGNATCTCAADVNCDDGLACTLNTCSNEGECIVTIKENFCLLEGACFTALASRDGNACQVCRPEISKTTWQSLVCDDQNQCTDDSCHPSFGCITSNDDTNACNDGSDCTQDDHCLEGTCVGQCDCVEDADCNQADAPACNKLVCQSFKCVPVADATIDGTTCDDGAFCTEGDTCQGGTCTPTGALDCSASGDGQCVLGICDEFGDQCIPQISEEGILCDDGDACSDDDTCSAGVCIGQALDCSGLSDHCNDGICDAGECQAVPTSGVSCNISGDPDNCWIDEVCTSSGQCEGTWDAASGDCGCATDADCTAQTDACNVGTCEPSTGVCSQTATEGVVCDDGNSCTADDVCGGDGLCGGAPYSCNDGLSCTTDVCQGDGTCTNTVKNNQCLVDGTCYNAAQTNPTNVCQICVGGGEAWTDNDNVSCDDGQACTQADTCGGGLCNGTDFSCTTLACQSATCNGDGTCDTTISGGSCVIDGNCYSSGETDPTNGCRSCNPSISQTAWTNNNATCDDGNACTHADICSGGSCGGTAYTCDDNKACTQNVCDGNGDCSYPYDGGSGQCLIGSECYADEQGRPGNTCEKCDTAGSTNGWTAVSQGTACTDGLTCTANDACDGAGACTGNIAGCTPLSCEDAVCNPDDTCSVTLKTGFCKIQGLCYGDGQANPAHPECQVCDANNPNAWTNVTGSCDDGEACTSGDSCTAGVCGGTFYSCDDGKGCTTDSCNGDGSCNNTVNSGKCLIGGTCYNNKVDNPQNTCQECTSAASQTSWTNTPNGTTCASDGLSCTSDTCSSGTCTHSYNSNSGQCLIGGTCYASGADHPSNSCRYCNTGTSWSNRPLGTDCASDGSSCMTCNLFGSCSYTTPAYTACDDGDSSTKGDWCHSGGCSGFTRTLHDGGTNDYYVDATSFDATRVHGWWVTNTNSNSDRYEGGTSPAGNIDYTGPTYNTRYFDADRYDAVGDNEGYNVFNSSTNDWGSDDPRTQFRALPARDFSAVTRVYNGLFNTQVKAAGWSGSVATVRSCSRGSICFPNPCTWSCADQTVLNGARYVDCAGGAEISDTGYLVCNFYAATTDTWPQYTDILHYDSADSRWENLSGGYEYLGNPNNTKKGRTVTASGNYLLTAGTGGFFWVAEISGGAHVGNSAINLPNFTDDALVEWTDSTVHDGRVWVSGRYVKSEGFFPNFYNRVHHVVAHAAVSSNLRTSSSWKLHEIDAYGSPFCLAPCPSVSGDFRFNGVAGMTNDLYFFGGWTSGEVTDTMDRAVWNWEKP